MKHAIKMTVSSLAFLGAIAVAPAMSAPTWGSPAQGVTLFYPGQSSWEWLLTPADHPGADKFRGGKNCAACHTGDEKNMGALIVSGKKNEPAPPAGKPGSLNAKVQFSHDADTLYVKISFADAGQAPSKVTMLLAGPGASEVNRAGCFAACHDDSAGMASAGGSTRTMYLGKTRAALGRTGGGDALKPAGELAKLKAAGYEVDYWQAHVGAAADNGVIFDRRAETKPTAVNAQVSQAGGVTTVVLSRKMNAGAVPVSAGKRYTVAFAIHGGKSTKRFHYVSFERSMVLDAGAADFVAK